MNLIEIPIDPVTIDIETYLDEVETETLKAELENRGVLAERAGYLDNVLNQMKIESFYSKLEDIPLNDLEEFLKKY